MARRVELPKQYSTLMNAIMHPFAFAALLASALRKNVLTKQVAHLASLILCLALSSWGGTSLFVVSPPKVYLQRGKTSQVLTFALRDETTFSRVPASDVRATILTSGAPFLFDGSTIRAFEGRTGWARIRVEHGPSGQMGTVDVYVGHAEITPPSLHLNPSQHAQLQTHNYLANGLEFYDASCQQFAGAGISATVSLSGLITAKSMTGVFPENIGTLCHQLKSNNTVVARVLEGIAPPALTELRGKHVSVHVPKTGLNAPVHDLYVQHDVTRIVDAGYEILADLFGAASSGGAHQHIVAHLTYGEMTFPKLGSAGNPILLFASLGPRPHSHMLVEAGHPGWHLFWHELGHNFVGANHTLQEWANAGSTDALRLGFNESLAQLAGVYVYRRFAESPARYGVGAATLAAMAQQQEWGNPRTMRGFLATDVKKYEEAGDRFWSDVSTIIIQEFGTNALYRFVSGLAATSRSFTRMPQNDTEQATLFAALWSGATNVDLRSRFRAWRFPIDNAYYDAIIGQVRAAVRQRDPVITPGMQRVTTTSGVRVTVPVRADDLLGRDITVTATLATGPGTASVVAAPDRVTFEAAKPGMYTIAVAAAVGIAASDPVNIQVEVEGASAPSVVPVERSGPSTVALHPASGAGSDGTFTATFTHTRGANALYKGYVLFLPTPNVTQFRAKGSCLIEYNRISNGVRLVDDAGTAWLGPEEGAPAGTAVTLKNAACTVAVASMAAVGAGDTLRVSGAVRFGPGMTRIAGTFIQALDMAGAWTGMNQIGSWYLPSNTTTPGPAITSIMASRTGGTSAVYTIEAGGSPIDLLTVLVGASITTRDVCQVVYFPNANVLNLINDAGTGLVAPVGIAPGATGDLRNSRCALDARQATRSGTSGGLRLTLPLSFTKGIFAGEKAVYANAFSGELVTHWLQGATMTIP